MSNEAKYPDYPKVLLSFNHVDGEPQLRIVATNDNSAYCESRGRDLMGDTCWEKKVWDDKEILLRIIEDLQAGCWGIEA